MLTINICFPSFAPLIYIRRCDDRRPYLNKSFNPRKPSCDLSSGGCLLICYHAESPCRSYKRDSTDGGSEASIIAAVGEIVIAAIRVWRHTSRFIVKSYPSALISLLNRRGRKTRFHNAGSVSALRLSPSQTINISYNKIFRISYTNKFARENHINVHINFFVHTSILLIRIKLSKNTSGRKGKGKHSKLH